jgi:hypothetical protein
MDAKNVSPFRFPLQDDESCAPPRSPRHSQVIPPRPTTADALARHFDLTAEERRLLSSEGNTRLVQLHQTSGLSTGYFGDG